MGQRGLFGQGLWAQPIGADGYGTSAVVEELLSGGGSVGRGCAGKLSQGRCQNSFGISLYLFREAVWSATFTTIDVIWLTE